MKLDVAHTCLKKCYPTKRSAKAAMKKLNDKGRELTAVYYCGTCSSWHTTSMDKIQSRNINKKRKK